MYKIRWIPQRIANDFIARHHFSLSKVQGSIFQLGLFTGEDLTAVIICGRPASAFVSAFEVLEVTRFGSLPDNRHAASRLYGSASRIAKEFGFSLIQTYIEAHESGISLKASNFVLIATNRGVKRNKQLWQRTL